VPRTSKVQGTNCSLKFDMSEKENVITKTEVLLLDFLEEMIKAYYSREYEIG